MHKISLNFYIIYLLIGFMDAVILVKFEIIQSAFLSKYLIHSCALWLMFDYVGNRKTQKIQSSYINILA